MNNNLKIFLPVILLISVSCTSTTSDSNNVTIGISADIESLNPMFAFHGNEASITELLFLSIQKHEWNNSTSSLQPVNMLAEDVRWDENNKSVSIKLRNGIFWSDSVKLTTDDVILSYKLYSDPELQSRALGMFENFILDQSGKINENESFEKISDLELIIHFKENSYPTSLDLDHPILPAHILNKINRDQISTSDFNNLPITNGPFRLKKWNKEQNIILEKNRNSFLITESSPDQIIFKVIPSYANQILQLKNGDIDFLSEIKPEDAEVLKNDSKFNLGLSKGRQYDYIGWNNIQPESYASQGKLVKHELFGDPQIRRALTHALNRKEVLRNYLYNYGEIAVGPISSEFGTLVDESLNPIEFDIQKSKNMLEEAGWSDSNNDGILDKDGKDFAFELYIPSGEPRREFAANIYNNNFKELGLDVEIKFVEMNSFIDGVFGKQYDAWMIAWTNPIPINLRIQWSSNLDETPFNLPSFQNNRVDELLDVIDSNEDEEKKSEAYKEINSLLFELQPVSFLYWIDGISVYNSRIENVKVDPLGSIQNCWEWKVN